MGLTAGSHPNLSRRQFRGGGDSPFPMLLAPPVRSVFASHCMESPVVSVFPLAGFDKELAYRVPSHLEEKVVPGSLVRVPIRRQHALAVVSRFGSTDDFPPERLKLVTQVLHGLPVLTPDLLEMARWMNGYYASSLESILETMVPTAIRKGARMKTETLLAPGASPSPPDMAALRKRAPRQAELLDCVLAQIRPQPKRILLQRLNISPATCRALVRRGWMVELQRRVQRTVYEDGMGQAELVGNAFTLNPEQEQAADTITASLDNGSFAVHLLHGVTGSGKTEVYLRLIQNVVSSGGGAVFLVPEVVLTPQTVGRLRGRLQSESGVKTVVWHSHLSDGERLDAWEAMVTGEARVVVGARSAVFAPLAGLRLIIVDEEHEPAYKQEESPRYHGRDAAVYRAKLNGAVCVLGSATPSLESLHNVGRGKYRISRLPKRVDDRKLPLIHVVDMRVELLSKKGSAPLSRLLTEMMRLRFETREQTILFLNRRGYSSSMLCPECGHVCGCDHCSVALTLHRTDDTLKCHLCGHQRPAPTACPQCSSPKIRWRGFGTQRVEEAIRRALPRAEVARLDTDAMAKKNRFREILAEFRLGRIDVVVGTQMIAKGLDFPNVTLVGLVDADLSLHLPDFRANERTFQLLVQVSGRAGRGDRPGDVVVQSFTPHASPIQYARRGDGEGFWEEEMEARRQFGYPPFRHLIHHLFQGRNPEKVLFFAEQWVKEVENKLGGRLEIRGPAPAPLEKIKDFHRIQVWYFCPSVSKIVGDLQALRTAFKWADDISQTLDIDPVNLM